MEVEFLGGVGDALEADEGPGRDEGYLDDLGKGCFVGDKGRIEGRGGAAMSHAPHGGDEAGRDGQRKACREARHEGCHGLFPAQAHGREDDDGRGREQDLAEVDVVVEDGVEPDELEVVAQKVPREERNGRGVGPEHGEVGQGEEPGGQEAVVVAEAVPRVGVGPSRLGTADHHVAVVAGDDQHDQAAGQQAEHAAEGAGLGQPGAAGNDKGPPAYAGPEGHGPCACRPQIGRKLLLFVSHLRSSLRGRSGAFGEDGDGAPLSPANAAHPLR